MIRIVSIAGFSKQGSRDNNEDYILYRDKDSPDSRFIILCDGMGGHGHGEVASQTVAEATFDYLKGLAKTEYEAEDLQDAINVALSALTSVDTFDDDKAMGTTIVVVVVNRMNVLVGHIGDSRCYLFDENGLKKFRTKDHSKVAEAIEAEILTEEEAFTNPYKNVLTRCVISGKQEIKIDVDILTIDNNDRMLLCSDGLNDAMRDSEIASCLINRSIDDALGIFDSECAAKSHDNYSIILIDFTQDEINQSIKSKAKSNIVEDSHCDENKQFICCPICQHENDMEASFCTNCGALLHQDIADVQQPEPVFFTKKRAITKEALIKFIVGRIKPILFVVLGIAIGICFCNKNDKIQPERQIADRANSQLYDISQKQKFENASIAFITQMCCLDSAKTMNDSILYKDSVVSHYLIFCQEYAKNTAKDMHYKSCGALNAESEILP